MTERKINRLTTGDDDFRAKFRSWNLSHLSYVDVREYLQTKDTILVPMASTEQHGPHLPLATDTITAVEISERISERSGFCTPRRSGQATPRSTCTALAKGEGRSRCAARRCSR